MTRCSHCNTIPLLAKAGAIVMLIDDQGRATCVRCFTGGRVVERKGRK